MNIESQRPDPAAVLRTLKDFQRATVNYVFERLYGPDETHRFLIADEVGLGKTMVARGLIARVVDHLWGRPDPINIVYICSNADIARQNINRLNITGKHDVALATRITLLPITVASLRNNPLNFVSFTPSTALDMRVGMGRGEERSLLYWMLDHAWGVHGWPGLIDCLAGTMSADRFQYEVEHLRTDPARPINHDLCNAFAATLAERTQAERVQGKETLHARLRRLCEIYAAAQTTDDIALTWRREGRDLIAELRTLLASTCLDELAPDLIVLDEFQRFKHLLDPNNPISEMAQRLFSHTREGSHTRVVLLSATPYKMYTTSEEDHADNHYRDFLHTTSFLAGDTGDTFKQLLDAYRSQLLRYDGSDDTELLATKHELETQLRRVMVRTERLAASQTRDGMLREQSANQVTLQASDLQTYLDLQQIARSVDEPDTLEYWKAAPYVLSFMDQYRLKHRLKAALAVPADEAQIAAILQHSSGLSLPWQHIATYSEIDPGNARLRSLFAQVIDTGAWQLLWIPPALPYYQLGGAFAEPALTRFTKRLIFSHWRMVPRAVASLLSYEAERWIAQWLGEDIENTAEARRRRKGLLQFPRPDKRSLPGMQALGLLYPSPLGRSTPLCAGAAHGTLALSRAHDRDDHGAACEAVGADYCPAC